MASYRYTAYGVPTYFGVADEVGNVSEPERLLFNGQPWFGQLGMYRLVNRWYSPHQASFITPDPLGLIDGPNRYGYGRNHPLMWIDPLGLAAEGPFAGFRLQTRSPHGGRLCLAGDPHGGPRSPDRRMKVQARSWASD